jgi:hypothetical protein
LMVPGTLLTLHYLVFGYTGRTHEAAPFRSRGEQELCRSGHGEDSTSELGKCRSSRCFCHRYR